MRSPFRTTNLLPFALIFFLAPLRASHGQNATAVRQFPNTKSGIFVFYDQPPWSMTQPQIDFFARNVVGCQKIPLDLVRAIRSVNPNFIVLNYRLAFGTYDTIPGFVVGNGFVNDWDSTRTHTDWFITDPGSPNPGGRVRQIDWNWFLMDISGEINGNRTNGWKEYWARSVLNQLRSTESDGVFADSYGLPWNLDYTPGWLQPPQDVDWIRHMNIFGNYAKKQLAGAPERFYFIPNIGPWITTRDTTSYGLYADGVMIEMFASPGPWDLYDIDDWRMEMDRILALEAAGRIVICQPIVEDEWAVGERLYNLANYLLIKGEKTYINIVFGENFFGRLIFLPEYRLPLGAYKGALPSNIDQLRDNTTGLYMRDYENGRVIVNPTWDSLSVPLDREYFTIDVDALAADPRVEIGEDGVLPDEGGRYRPVSGSVMIRPKSGVILLRSVPVGLSAPSRRLDAGLCIESVSPHPVGGIMTIRCAIAPSFSGGPVTLAITDLLGRRIAAREWRSPHSGANSIDWEVGAVPGGMLARGAYLLSLEAVNGAGSAARASRMILIAP